MDKAFQWLGGLLLVLVLAVGAPIGIAVAKGWTPAQTNSAMTGMFAVCGGSVALVALGFGVAAGLGATRGARGEQSGGRTSERPRQIAGDWEIDEIKREKARWDLQRTMMAAERDRRALLPAPEQEREVDPADAWLAELPAWEFVDAA